ncbi:MAG TPA: hypothetical protein DCL61_12190, partial [Cyanobacteria bacterium UBA12227]|nr:hypothetical protein [Cyanobacteria bacterium UBA12227]HAX88448.1 hypothetical protein [Cyanobacteria bacterium UBA11370]
MNSYHDQGKDSNLSNCQDVKSENLNFSLFKGIDFYSLVAKGGVSSLSLGLVAMVLAVTGLGSGTNAVAADVATD